MQKFRFRLAGLLRLRTQLEKSARRALATAMGDVAGAEQRLVVAETGLRECDELGMSTAASAPLARAMAAGLLRSRLRLQNELRAAEARLDRARGDWLERRREQRALELLRERRQGEWRREQEASEQRELEELAARRPQVARRMEGEA